MQFISGILFLILLLIIINKAFAQQGYNAQFIRALPLQHSTNPAYTPCYSYYIGFPGLTGLQFQTENSGFTVKNVLYKTPDDSVHFSTDKLLNSIKKNNYLSVGLENDIIAFGFKIKKGYLHFNLSERFNSTVFYTKDMLDFLVKGNSSFIGKNVSFKSIGLNANYYHEIGIGYSREIDKKWTAGIKVKYLAGIANIYTKKSDISIYTDPSDYALTVKTDFSLYSSLPGTSMLPEDSVDFSIEGKNFSKSLMKFKNSGLAFDLGVQYKYNDKLKFGASIIDLGYINWKSNTKNLVSSKSTGSYTFRGIDINEFFDNDSTKFDDKINEVIDSLSANLGLKTTYSKYRSNLISKIYLSGMYDVSQRDHLGLLIRSDIYQSKLKTALTIHYNHEFGKYLSLMTGYSLMTNNYLNLGFGFALNVGSVQLYTMTDNVITFLSPYKSKYGNLNFGINFVFGDKRKISKSPVKSEIQADTLAIREALPELRKISKEEKMQLKADEKEKRENEKIATKQEKKIKNKSLRQQRKEYRRQQKKKKAL